MKNSTSRRQTLLIEIANAITHGVGAALAIAGLVILIVRAVHTGSPMRIVTFSIYGAALVLFFLASTLFHSLIFTRAKRVFQILDHDMIYLVIAASYTPYCLVAIKGWQGWTLFGIIWAMAIAGIIYKSIWFQKKSKWSLWPAAGGRHHLYAGRPALQHANPLHASDLASFRHGRYGIHLLFNLVLRLIFNPMLKATVGNIRLIAFYFLHICQTPSPIVNGRHFGIAAKVPFNHCSIKIAS